MPLTYVCKSQAEPGTGNKAQAANAALTRLLERSPRSKCPALRGAADATGTRSTVSLENLAPSGAENAGAHLGSCSMRN